MITGESEVRCLINRCTRGRCAHSPSKEVRQTRSFSGSEHNITIRHSRNNVLTQRPVPECQGVTSQMPRLRIRIWWESTAFVHSDLRIGVFGAHTATGSPRALEQRTRAPLHFVHGLTSEIGETPPFTQFDLVTFFVLQNLRCISSKRKNVSSTAQRVVAAESQP